MVRSPIPTVVRFAALASALIGTSSRIVIAALDGRVFDVLGYFTVQSNLLVFAFLIVALVSSRRRGGLSVWLRRAHGGILLFILVTAIVYNVLLAGAVDDSGYSAVVLVINHTVTPALFLLDWVVAPGRIDYRPRDVGAWLLYPIVYGVLASVEGGVTGTFRYFFLDFVQPPPGVYLLGMAGVTLFFIVLAALIAAANRALIGRRASGERPANGNAPTPAPDALTAPGNRSD